MSSLGRAFCLLACLGACGNPAPIAARGPAYPHASEAAAEPPRAPRAATPAPATSLPALTRNAAPNPAPAATALSAFGEAPFAGTDPILVEQVSPDASWVALCRTTKSETGAVTSRRALVTPREEFALDAWLSASPDGRYVLLLQHGALELWDSETQTSVDLSALGADTRLSAETNANVRVLDFDAKSEHLLYVRRNANDSRVVLRTLSDGSERELDPGPGQVWRARFDPGGVFAALQMITADSNKNGKLDFPAPLLAAPRACGDSLAHFRTWEGRGDRPETVLLPLLGGAPIHEPHLLLPVLDGRLLRDEDGALLLDRGGKKRLLETAECKGRIVYADAQRELFIVGCAQKKRTGHVSLELVTSDGRKPLNLELASVDLDREVSDSARLVALYPGSDTVLFDADRRELITLQPGDSVTATRGAHALIRRGNALFVYDVEARRETALPIQLDKFPDIFRALPFVFVSPALVNLDRAEVVGVSKQRPLALSQGGQLLVAEVAADAPNWARGPLRWLTPSLAAP